MPFVALESETRTRIDITRLTHPKLELEGKALHCQDCERPVHVRHGSKVRAHFAHSAGECARRFGSHPVSAAHDSGKAFLRAALLEELAGYFHPRAEFEWRIPEAGRIADLALLFPNGWIFVHEVQLAGIAPSELAERTRAYHGAGVDVLWWVAGRAATPDNVEWLRRDGGGANFLELDVSGERVVGARDRWRPFYDEAGRVAAIPHPHPEYAGRMYYQPTEAFRELRERAVQRMLECWPRFSVEQYKRGLALGPKGVRSVSAELGSKQNAGVVRKVGKRWELLDREGLRGYRKPQFFSEAGLEAMRERSRRWREQGLFA